jgi:hypothetical protein
MVDVASLLLFIKIDRIQSFDILFFRVSFPIRLDARGQRRRLYETSPYRNSDLIERSSVSFSIRLAVVQASGDAYKNQQKGSPDTGLPKNYTKDAVSLNNYGPDPALRPKPGKSHYAVVTALF